MSATAGKSEHNEAPVTLLEKIATTISFLLVAAIIGILVWDAVHPNARPSFKTRIESLERTASTYRATLSVKNVGDDAAKSVQVHAELLPANADTAVAEADLEVDWLPGKSERRVVALFANPGSGTFRVRAEVRGYSVP
jgi:uncharacterized protein (TIGR02588 family)